MVWINFKGNNIKRKEHLTMAYVISEKCTACGKCKDICPVDAISKGEKRYVIDPDTCVSCGQCVDECESGAISED